MILKLLLNILNIMDDIYKNIEEYNPNKKRKIFIVFDDIIADMLSNKKRNPTLTEFFTRGSKVKISIAFITQSDFAVPKNIRLNSTHYFIKKVPNKWEFQQIAYNHSSDVGFKDFSDIYKKCTVKPYSCLVIDCTLASDNPAHFKKNLLGRV